MGHWWNDMDNIIPKDSEKSFSQLRFVHQKSHIVYIGLEPGPACREAVD